MATGNTARDYGVQLVHYLRKAFTKDDNGTVLTLGTVPDGALILGPLSGVQVNEAFNAGTLNELDIGTTATGDFFGTNLSLAAVAFVGIDEVVSRTVSGATTLTATPNLTGTAATTGKGEIVIAYLPNN
jgi:hypothetical protein